MRHFFGWAGAFMELAACFSNGEKRGKFMMISSELSRRGKK